MTTLLAPLPFADAAVSDLRNEHDWSARRGVPAHITLLGPFVPPSEATPSLVERLRLLVEREPSFSVSLVELRLLEHTACLLPEAVEPLARLTELMGRMRPDLGQFKRSYHLTVARGCDSALFTRVAAAVEPRLPIVGRLTEVALVESRVSGTVRTLARFDLAA
jgi:2'-5' RNA ligase